MKNIGSYITEKLKINRDVVSSDESKRPSEGDSFITLNAVKMFTNSPSLIFGKSPVSNAHIENGTIEYTYESKTVKMNVYVNSNGYYESNSEADGLEFVSVVLPLNEAEDIIENLNENNLLETAEQVFDKKHDWLFVDNLNYYNDVKDFSKILKSIRDAK